MRTVLAWTWTSTWTPNYAAEISSPPVPLLFSPSSPVSVFKYVLGWFLHCDTGHANCGCRKFSSSCSSPLPPILLLPSCLWSPALSRASAEGLKATGGKYVYTNFQTIRISSNLEIWYDYLTSFVCARKGDIFKESKHYDMLYTLINC